MAIGKYKMTFRGWQYPGRRSADRQEGRVPQPLTPLPRPSGPSHQTLIVVYPVKLSFSFPEANDVTAARCNQRGGTPYILQCTSKIQKENAQPRGAPLELVCWAVSTVSTEFHGSMGISTVATVFLYYSTSLSLSRSLFKQPPFALTHWTAFAFIFTSTSY